LRNKAIKKKHTGKVERAQLTYAQIANKPLEKVKMTEGSIKTSHSTGTKTNRVRMTRKKRRTLNPLINKSKIKGQRPR
jgi:hypothetical protein